MMNLDFFCIVGFGSGGIHWLAGKNLQSNEQEESLGVLAAPLILSCVFSLAE